MGLNTKSTHLSEQMPLQPLIKILYVLNTGWRVKLYRERDWWIITVLSCNQCRTERSSNWQSLILGILTFKIVSPAGPQNSQLFGGRQVAGRTAELRLVSRSDIPRHTLSRRVSLTRSWGLAGLLSSPCHPTEAGKWRHLRRWIQAYSKWFLTPTSICWSFSCHWYSWWSIFFPFVLP